MKVVAHRGSCFLPACVPHLPAPAGRETKESLTWLQRHTLHRCSLQKTGWEMRANITSLFNPKSLKRKIFCSADKMAPGRAEFIHSFVQKRLFFQLISPSELHFAHIILYVNVRYCCRSFKQSIGSSFVTFPLRNMHAASLSDYLLLPPDWLVWHCFPHFLYFLFLQKL